MVHQHILRLTAVAALAALAGAGAQAQTYAVESTATATSIVLATPRHFGEATEWVDAMPASNERSAIVAEVSQAQSEGLMNDTGEGGATDRVLAKRDSFNQRERDRIVAEWAAAEEARRVAALEEEQRLAAAAQEARSDDLLALMVIDETDPGNPAVHAYTPTDVSQWSATPVESPQLPTLPADNAPMTAIAPATTSELRVEGTAEGSAEGTQNQGGSDDAMPDAPASPSGSYSDGVDPEK